MSLESIYREVAKREVTAQLREYWEVEIAMHLHGGGLDHWQTQLTSIVEKQLRDRLRKRSIPIWRLITSLQLRQSERPGTPTLRGSIAAEIRTGGDGPVCFTYQHRVDVVETADHLDFAKQVAAAINTCTVAIDAAYGALGLPRVPHVPKPRRPTRRKAASVSVG